IIGTSHIAAESIQEVRKAVKEWKPSIIAIELDRKRLHSLLHPGQGRFSWRDIRRVGLKGAVFAWIAAWVEKYLGKKVGVLPGAEMREAVRLAQENKLPIALIDQDIEVTLRRFSQAFTWKEKFRLVWDIVRSPFSKRLAFDLSKVPSKRIVKQLVGEVKQRYPSVYKVLIEERNKVMAANLRKLLEHDHRILAVVGAGHEDDIMQLVQHY
ncbi:TraB/GumN family protein, partial [Candidatus Woesearchaeota archaeon]|nr:TraB/GumN family protein [Candidatus Woesearchaeota archaeon]